MAVGRLAGKRGPREDEATAAAAAQVVQEGRLVPLGDVLGDLEAERVLGRPLQPQRQCEVGLLHEAAGESVHARRAVKPPNVHAGCAQPRRVAALARAQLDDRAPT